MRAPDITFITKILQSVAEKNGIAIFSFKTTYFSVKEAKKEPNGKTNFLRPANLSWSQKRWWSQTTWGEAKFLYFGLKKANLATLRWRTLG